MKVGGSPPGSGTMNTEDTTVLLAVINADKLLVRVVAARVATRKNRPARLRETDQKAQHALEICLNAYKRGGCTSGQLRDLEKIAIACEEASK